MHGAAAGIIATFSSYHSAECNIIVFKVNNDKSIDDNVLVEDLFVFWMFLVSRWPAHSWQLEGTTLEVRQ